MSNTIEIEKLTAGAIFKLTCLSVTFALAPIGALSAVFALFGAPVTIFGAIRTGFEGFFLGLLVAPFAGLSFGLMSVVLVPFGWWVYGQFRPRSLDAIVKSHPDAI